MHDHETIKVEIEEDIRSTLNHGRVLAECFVGQEGGSPGFDLNSEEGLKLLPKSKQNHVASAHRYKSNLIAIIIIIIMITITVTATVTVVVIIIIIIIIIITVMA